MVQDIIHDLVSEQLHTTHHGTHGGFACATVDPGAATFTTPESHGEHPVDGVKPVQHATQQLPQTSHVEKHVKHKKLHTGSWRLHTSTNNASFLQKLKSIITGGQGHGHMTAQQMLAAQHLHDEMTSSGPRY